MARAIWSGWISFGLVSIPVKLYSATDPKDVEFHQFRKYSGKRIHNKRVAGNTDKEVPFEDIVKGYEASKGEFVIVTPEELESVEPRGAQAREERLGHVEVPQERRQVEAVEGRKKAAA